MWSIATHAGAGMAIAGITATYYALTRKNYQAEREVMPHETGSMDGNRLRKHSESAQLTASNLLLKRELEELSIFNGSSSGINILYQQKHPLHEFNSSRFEITPIISRVDTVCSEPDEDDLTSDNLEREDGVGRDPNRQQLSPSRGMKSADKFNKEPDSTTNIDVDKDSSGRSPARVECTGEKGADGDSHVIQHATEEYHEKKVGSEVSVEEDDLDDSIASETFGDKWKSIQETPLVARTTSPICFFKNHGFGNRIPPVRRSATTLNVNVPRRQSSSQCTLKKLDEPNHPEKSTEFILSPVLSESNDSICDAQNPEPLLRKRRKYVKPIDKTVIETNPVEEVSEYNKMLTQTAMLDMVQNCDESQLSSKFTPQQTNEETHLQLPEQESVEIPDTSGDMRWGEDKTFLEENISGCMGDAVKKIELDENDSRVFEEALLHPSQRPECIIASRIAASSNRVNDIPSNSWISYPVRIYANTRHIRIVVPWTLIWICVAVVIIGGILIVILSALANSVYHRRLHKDII